MKWYMLRTMGARSAWIADEIARADASCGCFSPQFLLAKKTASFASFADVFAQKNDAVAFIGAAIIAQAVRRPRVTMFTSLRGLLNFAGDASRDARHESAGCTRSPLSGGTSPSLKQMPLQ
jgi:hypothetical protein